MTANFIQTLLDQGVAEFCLCAGARNATIIKTFSENPQIPVFHFFEERSAAFFALGRMQKIKKPVAVVTTSGTAVAELLPAVIEAFYSGLPLVLITADRPKNYRGSGAPQAIEQVGIFSHYVDNHFDFGINEFPEFKDFILPEQKPVHFNVCFEEPLIDGHAGKLKLTGLELIKVRATKVEEEVDLNYSLKKFCELFIGKKPFVIVSGLQLEIEDEKALICFLNKHQFPLYLEGTSGLKHHPELQRQSLLAVDKVLKVLIQKGEVDCIFRIGGIPTLRFWRDLEFDYKYLPVYSLSEKKFTGLSRESNLFCGIKEFIHFVKEDSSAFTVNKSSTNFIESIKKDSHLSLKLLELFKKYPKAEPAMIHSLSVLLQANANNLYLGNSLPIREWDLAADRGTFLRRVFANRGANGIDGQISTFLGIAHQQENSWALLGDLTTMYDLAALWISEQIKLSATNIVVINNQGGMIFERIFKNEYFLNRHQIQFKSWATMWNWSYQKWTEIPAKINQEVASDKNIIELVPCAEQTAHFWKDWDSY